MLGFVDSLYAGALALGVSQFINGYFDVQPALVAHLPGPLVWLIPLLSLSTACAFVIDDWRHAQAPNADYGFRLDPREPAWRFWTDVVSALLCYFVVSFSFTNPTAFVGLLAVQHFLAWIWARCLHQEIKGTLARGEFPPNRLGLSRSVAARIRGDSRAYTADYRVKFVVDSHWVAAVFLAAVWLLMLGHVYEYTTLLASVSAPDDPSATRAWIAAEFWWGVGGGTLLPAALFAVLKGSHHYYRGVWLAEYQQSGGEDWNGENG